MEVLIIVIFSKLILSEGGVGGRIRVRARTILGVNLLHINQIQIILILHFFDISAYSFSVAFQMFETYPYRDYSLNHLILQI